MLAIFLAVTTAAAALPANPAIVLHHQGVELHFTPRTPQQMAAFYEARGFPGEMVDLLAEQCFITVRINNRRNDVLWHDLGKWRFSNSGKPLPRDHRNDWKQRWQEMQIPMPSQSTFRWTLLPEKLDYQPGEAEGGNIILPRVDGPVSVELEFATGPEGTGARIVFDYRDLYCARDPS